MTIFNSISNYRFCKIVNFQNVAAIGGFTVLASAALALVSFAAVGIGVISWTFYFQPMLLLSPGGLGLCVVMALDAWLLRRIATWLRK